jgi:chromosome segregation ATPase
LKKPSKNKQKTPFLYERLNNVFIPLVVMTLGTSSGNPVQNLHSSSNEDRAALEGMLKSYPVEQLIDEVLIAWEELAQKNDEMVNLKQKMRILELDLAEREDAVAPELAQLENVSSDLTNAKGRIVHLERLLEDAKNEIQENRTSVSIEIKERLEKEALHLRNLTQDQDQVIVELEERMQQMVIALEKAADAGLTGITADEVRSLKSKNNEIEADLKAEKASNDALEEERQRLRDIADRLRGLLDQRDSRLGELEEQLERVMQGPRSVSAEHDYLVEQIDELKRRLLERNREYESLRRRERRLHQDVFERDERIQQMSLTIADLEGALTDRVNEIRELEDGRENAMNELDSMKRSERTREVVNQAFADSLTLVRSHDERKLKKEIYANSPHIERKISSPNTDDMQTLVEGGKLALEKDEEILDDVSEPIKERPESPGGTGDPVLFDDD